MTFKMSSFYEKNKKTKTVPKEQTVDFKMYDKRIPDLVNEMGYQVMEKGFKKVQTHEVDIKIKNQRKEAQSCG